PPGKTPTSPPPPTTTTQPQATNTSVVKTPVPPTNTPAPASTATNTPSGGGGVNVPTNTPGAPSAQNQPAVVLPSLGGAQAAWTPINASGSVCVDWLVYHTDRTGDWEIFRLGDIPGKPSAN